MILLFFYVEILILFFTKIVFFKIKAKQFVDVVI